MKCSALFINWSSCLKFAFNSGRVGFKTDSVLWALDFTYSFFSQSLSISIFIYVCLPVEVDDDGPQGREEEVAQSLEDVASSLAHLLMRQFKCYHKFFIFWCHMYQFPSAWRSDLTWFVSHQDKFLMECVLRSWTTEWSISIIWSWTSFCWHQIRNSATVLSPTMVERNCLLLVNKM